MVIGRTLGLLGFIAWIDLEIIFKKRGIQLKNKMTSLKVVK